ncbi:MAG TPA: prolyl oligopeptidase family serine peptidase [Burkholderiaceae bacterium]|nr:prolyl oligopeptidase family serine peptidase [Burkholderiaceae bacterium]
MKIALVLTAILATTGSAADIAGVEIPPPFAAGATIDTYWNVNVPDPYRALENVADPQVQQWMRSQADATTAVLAKIPARNTLLARIRELEAAGPGAVSAIDRTPSGRLFFLRREPADNQFKLVWRDRVDGADTVIVDPEALAKVAGQPQAILDYSASPDGRYLAYALQVGGSEIGLLHVVDVASGKPVIEPIDRIRFSSVSWLDDNSGFFYSRLREGYDKLPATERFGDRTRYFRSIKSADHRPVFSPTLNPDLKLPIYAGGTVFQIPGTQTAACIVSLGVERYQLAYVAPLADAVAGTAKWRQLVELKDKVAGISFTTDAMYFRTSAGASRYKVMRVSLANHDLAKAETIVAPGRDVLVSIGAAQDALYVTQRRGVTTTLLRVPHQAGAQIEQVALPVSGSASLLDTDIRLPGAVLSLAGWTRTAKPYYYSPVDKKLAALDFVRPGAFDSPQDIEAREVVVKSHDGVEIPVSVLARKDIKLDGGNPTIVYGYGSYGITENPFFSARVYAWLERGGVYAIAHVRGSGALGEEWHYAGRKATKPNTWKDGIAVAEYLIANRYTSRERIGIYGGSAGGIFVGRAITERPELFAAAVPSVGVMDMVRTESSANGVANIPEFGTVKNEDEFRALLAMSSYHHIKDGVKYPAVMLVHGVNDTRVDVWQSAKFASRLASAQGEGKPVLMRLDYELGHGGGGTRAQQQAQTADIWSFFLWQFGVPEFQPK